MPNDHVMCFKVWNELYSCLTHDYHDDQIDHVDMVANHMQDDFSYHGYNDDITNEHLSHDIHCSSPFTMDTIQQRLQDLLYHPEEEKLSLNLNPSLANQEAVDDHTSIEADNVENQHQVNVIYIFDYHYYGCHGSGKWLLRKMLQGQNGYQTMPPLTAILATSHSTNYYIANITAGKTILYVISFLITAHPYRNCGNVFCNSCSNYFCPVPHELLTDPQRVCKKCYEQLYNSSVVVEDHDVT